MKKVILMSFLFLAMLPSCKKDIDSEIISSYKSDILIYLDKLKENTSLENEQNLVALAISIDFNKTTTYQLRHGEQAIVADLNKFGALQNYDKLKAYFIVTNNEIVRSGLVGFNNKTPYLDYEKLILRRLNADKSRTDYSGQISTFSPTSHLLASNEYESGKLVSNGTVRAKEKTKTNGRINGCADWYQVVTIWYSDGSSSSSATYLYTECDPCQENARSGRIGNCGGGGGGAGSSNGSNTPAFPTTPQNNQVHEFVDSDGTYRKYKFNSQKNQWDLVESRLLEITVRARPELFYFLDIQWPADKQSVLGPDNVNYTYDIEFNMWHGVANVEVAPPLSFKIQNIDEYLKCFNRNMSAQITIFVDEPLPGTGDSFDKSNVGHAFISITQLVNGQMITRTMGFYPEGWATPINPLSSGALFNDSGHAWDVQLTVNITSSQLTSILNSIAALSTNSSDLNNFNCTNFALNSCSSGGISLPQTIGSWPGGQGLNPGNLGKDIMEMILPLNYVSRSNSGGIGTSNRGNCN
jgi:hypothetical protein